MATKDLRRTDERVPINSESFIFTSALIKAEDKADSILLASFPKGNYIVFGCLVEILEVFDGAGTIDVGSGTMPTNVAGVITPVDADEYIKAADITAGTLGLYQAATSDLVAALAAGTGEAQLIRGAATTTPVIYASIGGAPTTGEARVHMILMKLPTA